MAILILACTQIAAIAWQAQSSFGADLTQRGPDAPVVPALYTFGIWGLIYSSSLIYAVYQALPIQAAQALHRRTGWWIAAAFCASSLWALAAGAPPPWATWGTVAMIFCLFAGLLGAYLQGLPLATSRADRLLVVAPVALYLGYVTLATVANTASTLWQSGITAPLGLPPTIWAVLMLMVAGSIASLLAARERTTRVYPAAVVWGLLGVLVQNAVVAPNLPIALAAGLAAGAVVVTSLRRWKNVSGQSLQPL